MKKDAFERFGDRLIQAQTQFEEQLYEEQLQRIEPLLVGKPTCCQQTIREVLAVLKPPVRT